MSLHVLCAIFAGCAKERSDEASRKERSDEIIVEGVSLHELLENKDRYKDQSVVLAAYFVTHHDGPWICAENGDWKKRLQTTLSVEKFAAAKVKVTQATHARVASEFGKSEMGAAIPEETIREFAFHIGGFRNGLPALIRGTFRIGDYTSRTGFLQKNKPFLELDRVEEVYPDDPRWASKQREAEPAGTGQPATRPVVEPEGGDKPQPEAEGRSR